MTKFQFTLIMRTLLAMFRFRLDDRTTEGWEKANKEWDEIKGLFSLWQWAQEEAAKDEQNKTA